MYCYVNGEHGESDYRTGQCVAAFGYSVPLNGSLTQPVVTLSIDTFKVAEPTERIITLTLSAQEAIDVIDQLFDQLAKL